MEESSSNFLIRRSLTSGSFRFAGDDEEDVEFDTSDVPENGEVLMAAKQYPSIQEFASAIPNHLLLGSLLEHLCVVYEKDPHRSRMLFKVIGQRLATMNLLSPLAISDEFSSVRLQHNRAFTELLHAASTSLFPQDHRYLNTDDQGLKIRSKDGLFQTQTSRYLSEFEELCSLGKGSYGKVFKVRNKLDGQYYAIKKILIKRVAKDDCMKVLREVKVLSSLQHSSIVGYHTAWMEHVQPAVANQKPYASNIAALDKLSERDKSAEQSSAGSSIVFESSSLLSDVAPEASGAEPGNALVASVEQGQVACPKRTHSMEHLVPCVFLTPSQAVGQGCPVTNWGNLNVIEDQSNRGEPNNNEQMPQGQFHLMLYIQMQLCELSLRDWILQRNSRYQEDQTSPSDPYKYVDTEKTFNIFRTILEGVMYIHSRGIMHRDLKPRNIFLHGHDCSVRIGDFGLACMDIIMDGAHHVPYTSSLGAQGGEPSHTTGVGTFVYAAPEQLNGSHYDSKSDMYSVGVLALELFQPFRTEMERVHTLGELQHGKIPQALSQRWPRLSHYIHLLTSSQASVRPSAAQLLHSELFTHTMVIHSLQRKLQEQEEEIVQLRRRISELQCTQNTQQHSELD